MRRNSKPMLLALPFADLVLCSAADFPAITGQVRFSENVLPFDGGLLIPDFGSETMSPAPGERLGFILHHKDDATRTLVPANGRLRLPTGMGRTAAC